MQKTGRAIGLLLNFVLSSQLISQAPAQSGQISGHIVDPMGAVVAKANIFVRRNLPAEEKIELAMHSDSNGNFVLTLPAGAYDILVTSVGFESKVQTLLVQPGKENKSQWKLTIPPQICSFPGMNCDTFK